MHVYLYFAPKTLSAMGSGSGLAMERLDVLLCPNEHGVDWSFQQELESYAGRVLSSPANMDVHPSWRMRLNPPARV